MADQHHRPGINEAGITAAGEEPVGEQNVLKIHVAFFDQNNDGIVYPWETIKGFRALGFGLTLSIFTSLIINMAFSKKTRPGKCPSLLFPIEIEHIAKAKHGSDTDVYDTDGRFVESKFEEIFIKHAHTTPDALTADELKEMVKGNREPKDCFGWIAAYGEWKLMYRLCKDKKGLLQKDTMRALYDGSLFYKIAEERATSRNKV